jgi:hypothetical protein
MVKGNGYGNLKPKEYIIREELTLMVYRVIEIIQN